MEGHDAEVAGVRHESSSHGQADHISGGAAILPAAAPRSMEPSCQSRMQERGTRNEGDALMLASDGRRAAVPPRANPTPPAGRLAHRARDWRRLGGSDLLELTLDRVVVRRAGAAGAAGTCAGRLALAGSLARAGLTGAGSPAPGPPSPDAPYGPASPAEAW